MKTLLPYQSFIEQEIQDRRFDALPKELYEPINYMLSLGGKRVRSVLCLMATQMFQDYIAQAINPALALEFFHSFSLMHDDIMDKAPLRRGKLSVYQRSGLNQAILSGDLLLIKSYQFFKNLKSEIFHKVSAEFSEMAVKVCEGQQMDLNLERAQEVQFEQYMEMITYKTAALMGSSLKIGALVGGASEQDTMHLYETGKNIGIAFQIQDDLLDVFGDEGYFGKKRAGDIYHNKKTILYFKALEKADTAQREEILYWYSSDGSMDKIYAVETLFKKLRVKQDVEKELEYHRDKSLKHLAQVSVGDEKKKALRQLIDELIIRAK
ncbi:MAG: polyprenyl synthetase family protein [Flavobacteriales bacterium]